MKNIKRKKFIRGLTLCAFGFALLAALRSFAITEPQTQLGSALFRSSYALASSKNSALQGFDSNLVKHNGGYIPEPIDKFLCSKLQSSSSHEELNAITNFYVSKAGGREGRYIFSLPAQAKQQITGNILDRLEDYNSQQTASALILVEVMRRGKPLGKAIFRSTRGDAPAYPQYELWQQRALPKAKAQFRGWWRAYSSWQEKEKHNPLEKSGLEISAP